MPPQIKLEVIDGPLRGTTFDLEGRDTLLFGRRSHCHARLSEACVSRHHFILETNWPQLAIRDLGSLYGTYVNGCKHGGRDKTLPPEDKSPFPSVDLSDGDQISVGRTVMKVRVLSEQHLCCRDCGAVASGEDASEQHVDNLCKTCRDKLSDQPVGIRRLLRAAQKIWRREGQGTKYQGYEITGELGRGNMGVVYAAQRKSDGRRVAVKVMHPRAAINERMRNMFLREMEITRQLQHANIVRLLEAKSSHKDFFFVIEYCDAGNLESLMKRFGEKIPPHVLAPLMCQCLDGLQYAHDRGVVHRDLKPENVLVCETDHDLTAKIADLGLAKNFDQAGMSGMTMNQEYAGTIAFMPREQVTEFRYERPISDVWSMAATFYFALTACFVRDFNPQRDPIEVVLHGDPVPILEREPQLPAALAAVLDRALSDDKSQRYQTAAEMKAALQQAI